MQQCVRLRMIRDNSAKVVISAGSIVGVTQQLINDRERQQAPLTHLNDLDHSVAGCVSCEDGDDLNTVSVVILLFIFRYIEIRGDTENDLNIRCGVS